MKRMLFYLLSLIIAPLATNPASAQPNAKYPFEFEVYAEGSLLWKGRLPAEETEIKFPMASAPAATGVQPYLIVRREIVADPEDRAVYFAEAKFAGLKTFTSGDSIIQIPELEMNGGVVFLKDHERVSVSLKGQASDLRFVAWQQERK